MNDEPDLFVSPELVGEWLQHPITQFYKRTLQRSIEKASDIDTVSWEPRDSLEEIGTNFLARLSYLAGLRDASDLRSVIEAGLDSDE